MKCNKRLKINKGKFLIGFEEYYFYFYLNFFKVIHKYFFAIELGKDTKKISF